ncbi:MAG: hypothetical protein LQ338_008216 [Usnochroma carphineum]|nr:MAG: hypothetical protein LQ338_008216 [Usnochroma carphineum]
MIWNHQVLEFAGYEMDDGSILGDPMSAALTKAIIELGWEPPNPRTRWDLLPLVVMADDDVPVMIEIPSPLRDLIHIRHPQYDEVGKLDLRWVTCPALTRLGFDIGGVQYTAAPFIGWFMDAEIGVRDLADTFRYNVLPDVVKALGLLNGKLDGGMEGLEDLPEYEQMSILSRAQTELTYAVTWSYQQAKVSISDTLTASTKWCRYDDEFKAKHGYRLPADPYWLAPPQGSIIPAWHRGGAPNYQPKPMISRHVQDPLKAWQREKKDYPVATKQLKVVSRRQPRRPQLQSRSKTCGGGLPPRNQPRARDTVGSGNQRQTQRLAKALQDHAPDNKKEVDLNQPLVSVYYCSAGTFAEKVAAKLHIRLRDLAKSIPTVSVSSGIQPLNQLQPSAMTPKEVVLAVVSSTGQGEVPANGIQFIRFCDEMPGNDSETPQTGFSYAIYGNGDSRYSTTYNGAAEIVEQKFRQLGGLAFAGGLYHGDTALQATALQALSPWWAKLQPLIQDLATDKPKLKRAHSYQVNGNGHVTQPLSFQAEASLRLNIRGTQLEAFQMASVVKVSPSIREGYQGTYLVSLDVKDRSYEDLSCIQILPVNTSAKVRRALRALGVNATDKIFMDVSETSRPTFSVFLTEYIDLELPFQNLGWLKSLPMDSATAIKADVLRSSPCLDALEHLHESGLLTADTSLMNAICLALPPLHPRTYSIASSLSYSSSSNRQSHSSTPSNNNHLDILVKPFPQGRFSHAFLSSPTHTSLRYKLVPSSASALLALPPTTPLIILATGAGFAPVRSLLQRRIAAAAAPSSRTSSSSHNHQQHTTSNNNASISLFLGLKPADIPLLSDTLNEAAAAGLLDSLAVVCSNEGGVRVYDRLREEGIREKVRGVLVGRGGWVFVCMNPEAARGTRGVFEEVLLGVGGVEGMGERWVEEIF